MAADPSHTRNSGLKVQACGDAHLWNFGGFATPDRNVIFDTRSRAEVLRQLWEIMLGHASRACFFNSFQSTFSIASWGASLMKRFDIDPIVPNFKRLHECVIGHLLAV